MRRAVLTMLLAVTVGAAATTLAVAQGADVPLESDYLAERITGCITMDNYLTTGPDCLAPWWNEALKSGQLAQLDEAVRTVAQTEPGVLWACHDAGHLAGIQTARNADNLPSLLTISAGARTCEGGLTHGLLDGFSMQAPTSADVDAVVQACLSIADTEQRHLCADGVGHASWQATSDPLEAARWCARFPTDGSSESCLRGILMQLPRSYVDGRAPAYDVKKKPQVLPATCAAATQALTDRDVVACYTSAARELALIASDEGVRWAQQHQERGADSHTWGDLSDAWERALRSCRLFPDEYQAMCEEQVASSPAVNIPASFPFRGEACDVWAALDHQELCMETLAERTTQPQ